MPLTMKKVPLGKLILIINLIFLIKLIDSSPIDVKEINKVVESSKISAKFHVDHVEFPPEGRDKYFDYGTIRTRKYNRTTYVVDGYYDILQPFADDLIFKVEMYPWQGNEYRKIGDRTFSQACTALREEKSYFPDILKKTNIDPNFKCPIPAMHIIVNNVTIPDLPQSLTYTLGNRFRVTIITLSAKEEVLATYSGYFVKEV